MARCQRIYLRQVTAPIHRQHRVFTCAENCSDSKSTKHLTAAVRLGSASQTCVLTAAPLSRFTRGTFSRFYSPNVKKSGCEESEASASLRGLEPPGTKDLGPRGPAGPRSAGTDASSLLQRVFALQSAVFGLFSGQSAAEKTQESPHPSRGRAARWVASPRFSCAL